MDELGQWAERWATHPRSATAGRLPWPMADPWQLWEIRNPDGGADRARTGRERGSGSSIPGAAARRARASRRRRSSTSDGRVRRHEDAISHADGATPDLAAHGRRTRRCQRENIWPTEDDLGTVVILPGGEAGILTAVVARRRPAFMALAASSCRTRWTEFEPPASRSSSANRPLSGRGRRRRHRPPSAAAR